MAKKKVESEKNPAAIALGWLGGLKGGAGEGAQSEEALRDRAQSRRETLEQKEEIGTQGAEQIRPSELLRKPAYIKPTTGAGGH